MLNINLFRGWKSVVEVLNLGAMDWFRVSNHIYTQNRHIYILLVMYKLFSFTNVIKWHIGKIPLIFHRIPRMVLKPSKGYNCAAIFWQHCNKMQFFHCTFHSHREGQEHLPSTKMAGAASHVAPHAERLGGPRYFLSTFPLLTPEGLRPRGQAAA